MKGHLKLRIIFLFEEWTRLPRQRCSGLGACCLHILFMRCWDLTTHHQTKSRRHLAWRTLARLQNPVLVLDKKFHGNFYGNQGCYQIEFIAKLRCLISLRGLSGFLTFPVLYSIYIDSVLHIIYSENVQKTASTATTFHIQYRSAVAQYHFCHFSEVPEVFTAAQSQGTWQNRQKWWLICDTGRSRGTYIEKVSIRQNSNMASGFKRKVPKGITSGLMKW